MVSMLYDSFLNNSDHWFGFEKPEDLDFIITIKTTIVEPPM